MLDTRRCLDVNLAELQAELDRTRAALGEESYQKLRTAIEALQYLEELVADQTVTMAELRRLIVIRGGTEKTQTVLQRAGPEPTLPPRAPAAGDATDGAAPRAPARGHGRTGAAAYTGARRIVVPHATLRRGDHCPTCAKGKVYPLPEPKRQIRFVGQAPVQATVYERERLRCNLCNDVFTAAAPAGVGEAKYDETAVSTLGLLKYGSGMPFARLTGLQARYGIPLPESTQYGLLQETAGALRPALDDLIRHAAQGEVLHNDDTAAKILGLTPEAVSDETPGKPRTGTFTSAIVARVAGHSIALFFTGRRHAGENLAAVLAHRAAALAPPIQMCEALTRNLPKPLEVLLANCLAHGRRQFVQVADNFPHECRHVLHALAEIYRVDDQARAQGLAPEARLQFHQTHSAPVMTALQGWLTAQLDEHQVEPNSGLGRAIRYLLTHWDPLTLFLRAPGAPLDNNVAERALKKAILNRKNAFFYKTEKGARVGDLYMSLIHTCELNGINAFDYLTELQRHAAELSANPSEWLPWNYRETLARAGGSGGPAP
jgi:transposase